MSDAGTAAHGGVVLQTIGLSRSFEQGGERIDVLRGVDLSIAPGEIVALLGPSGSGKSTLLQAVGLLEGGFTGSIRIAGAEAAKLDSPGRTAVRRDSLGFVYQFHHLLPDFDARENVEMPQLIHGAAPADARARAESLLTTLGLGHRLTHRPSQLSGGEQQRVAVARALANRPALVLADEPTGNLDEATANIVFAEFLRLVREEGSAALVATTQRTARDAHGPRGAPPRRRAGVNLWRDAPTLVGRHVTLRPLVRADKDALLDAYAPLAGQFTTAIPTADTIHAWFDTAERETAAGRQMPFAVLDSEGRVSGSTRYRRMNERDRRLEIGTTAYAPRVQRTGLNTEAKRLLLAHAFDLMQVQCVQIRTDFLNRRSRARDRAARREAGWRAARPFGDARRARARYRRLLDPGARMVGRERQPRCPAGEPRMTAVTAFHVRAADGSDADLSPYAGRVLLVVNTASRCGFTPQYEGLEALHRRYADRGFAVLGFPCNQFGAQEPGDALEIASFCSLTYDVTFPVFAKVEVNGQGADPLFAELKKQAGRACSAPRRSSGTSPSSWSVAMGQVVERYAPTTKPEAIAADIERLLG